MRFGIKVWAFLRRDLSLELSYRFSAALHVFAMLAHLLTFYFIGKLVDAHASAWLEPYGRSYFSFVLVGIAFTGFLGFGLSGVSSVFRSEQTHGTLEALLATPTPIWQLALAASVSGYLIAVIESAAYLVMGRAFLGADLSRIAWGTTAVSLVLSISAFSAVGVLAGSFILYFKRGDPINWAFGALSQLLGGVYFPVSLLPPKLGALALLLPVTHGLEALRMALLEGAGLAEVRGPLLALSAFSVVGWPLALGSLRLSLDAARRRGTLGHQ